MPNPVGENPDPKHPNRDWIHIDGESKSSRGSSGKGKNFAGFDEKQRTKPPSPVKEDRRGGWGW